MTWLGITGEPMLGSSELREGSALRLCLGNLGRDGCDEKLGEVHV
jgi:hypothetical protein